MQIFNKIVKYLPFDSEAYNQSPRLSRNFIRFIAICCVEIRGRLQGGECRQFVVHPFYKSYRRIPRPVNGNEWGAVVRGMQSLLNFF